MALVFNVVFDVPDSGRVEYDEKKLNLHIDKCLSAQENVCELISPYTLFKLFARCNDGFVIGLETDILGLDKLPKTTFDLKCCVEGKARVITDFGKLRQGYKYLLDFDGEPKYDKDNGLIVFGKPCAEGMTVKIFSNAYLTVDFMGNLSNIVIKL